MPLDGSCRFLSVNRVTAHFPCTHLASFRIDTRNAACAQELTVRACALFLRYSNSFSSSVKALSNWRVNKFAVISTALFSSTGFWRRVASAIFVSTHSAHSAIFHTITASNLINRTYLSARGTVGSESPCRAELPSADLHSLFFQIHPRWRFSINIFLFKIIT